MTGKVYVTRRGIKKLKDKIDELEEELRNRQFQTNRLAEVGGDQYHDNSAYEQLVIELRGLNWRLNQTHKDLNRSVLIEPPKSNDKIRIGHCIKILKDGEERNWEIVGFGESDPPNGLIAYNTPIASLVIGKKKGDEVTGIIAKKQTRIKILEITKGKIDEMQ